MGPLLHGFVIDSFIASKSRRSVLANWAVKRNPETVAEFIHVFNLLALRQQNMGSGLKNKSAQLVSAKTKAHERV
jgi:hypothetical protein